MKGYDLYLYLARYAVAFSLVLVRVSFFLGFLPVFGSRMVPATVKAAASLVLALILTPLAAEKAVLPETTWGYLLAVVPEALLGLSMAFLIRLVFAGVQFGGQILGFQMGFGVANIIDPATGVETPVLSQMAYLLALLFFLLFDIHHYLFLALGEGLRVFPPGSLGAPREVFLFLVTRADDVFRLAIKVLAPALTILLLIQIALGIVSRFVPQINVMIVSFPLTIGAGLIFFGLTLEVLGQVLEPAYRGALEPLPTILRAFGG